MNPIATFQYSKGDSVFENSESIYFRVEEFGLGLKGKIGEKLEFALMPSIQSKVFLSGLEIRYLF